MSPTPLVQPLEGELKLNGLRIHYLEWKGEGERPLVLLHGLRDCAYYWQDLANRLLDRFHIYAFDQRGHGKSEHAPGGYLVWALAADLAAFVEAMGLNSFDLLGFSLGARCAMAYARDHWPRLRHLVLADMGPQMSREGARRGMEEITARASGPPRASTHSQALTLLRQQWPTLDEPSLERLLDNALTRREDGLYTSRYDRRLADITTKVAIPEIPFLWDALAHIQCPTLVLRGERSPLLDEEIAARMLQVLPRGHYHVLRDAGHALPRLQPHRFAQAVRCFLLDQPLPQE